MAGNDHDIHVLNRLIKTTLDSRKGFIDAAEDAETTRFKTLFSDFAQDRADTAALLQAEVRRLGGNPEDDSSFIAAAHRTFMNLRELLSARDDKAIIAEVERGEDYIKAKYEEALRDDQLSPSSRSVIERAFQSVRAGHDRASELKHAMSSSQ